MTEQLAWLDPDQPAFPSTRLALEDPPGLLAAGGNLSTATLKSAYYQGIFPWYSDGEPPLWWSPNPRAVLMPGNLHIGRTTEKIIKRQNFSFTTDKAFPEVIQHCSDPRQDETWIVEEMINAYIDLHKAGFAHSLEVWESDTLVGGLYGVQIGSVFCGESMFHKHANASKLAFICLSKTLFRHGFSMIDCQLANPFLDSLGVQETSRELFEKQLFEGRDRHIVWPDMWTLAQKKKLT